jgi:uncharacterized protein with HEPN domain
MPQRDPGVYLEDIERYAAAAIRFTAGYSVEQYLADEKTRAAVERVLEICDIVGFRNILAHGYAELDHRKVYAIALVHAPQLLDAVREALKAFPEPPAE